MLKAQAKRKENIEERKKTKVKELLSSDEEQQNIKKVTKHYPPPEIINKDYGEDIKQIREQLNEIYEKKILKWKNPKKEIIKEPLKVEPQKIEEKKEENNSLSFLMFNKKKK